MAATYAWRDKIKNEVLLGSHPGSLPRLSTNTRMRRLRMAGHCVRHPELPVSNLILWEPMHGVDSGVRKMYRTSQCKS